MRRDAPTRGGLHRRRCALVTGILAGFGLLWYLLIAAVRTPSPPAARRFGAGSTAVSGPSFYVAEPAVVAQPSAAAKAFTTAGAAANANRAAEHATPAAAKDPSRPDATWPLDVDPMAEPEAVRRLASCITDNERGGEVGAFS